MFWKITGNDDDLSVYAEADDEAAAKAKVEELTGYLKPQHITIASIARENIPEDETVL